MNNSIPTYYFLRFSCWMDSGESIWFLAVPVIMAISFNVLIVINVILLIKRNRNVQSEDRYVLVVDRIYTYPKSGFCFRVFGSKNGF